jgi:hypothetical protein
VGTPAARPPPPRGAPRPAVLGILLAAALSTAWILRQSPSFFSGYDFVRMHLFYKAYLRDALLSGRLPLWNPYVGLGRPFMADIETASLYPPSLLLLVFGVYGGVAASVLLHQALAIYGGLRLGRLVGASPAGGWLLGCGAALGAAFVARLGAGIVEGYFSLCWLPALLWLGGALQDRRGARAAAAFSAAVALSILAGQPPLLYVEFLGVAVFLALRQPWPSLRGLPGVLFAGCLGAGLAGAALLPFMELVGQGNRPLNAAAFATANGMPAAAWLSLIIPTSRAFAPNWEYDVYCGLVPALAALGAALSWRDRNVRAFLGMGAVGVLLAAGDRAPFLGWASHVVPGMGALRIPSRYAVLVPAAVLGLGALGLTRRPARPLPVLAAGVIAGCLGILWLARHPEEGVSGTAAMTALRCAALLAAAFVVWLWHERSRLPGAGVAAALLLACACAGDWLLAIRLQAPVYSGNSAPTRDAAVRAAAERAGLFTPGGAPPRISFNPGDVRENAGMIQGFSTYNSYVAPSLARTWDYVHAATGAPPNPADFIQMSPAIYERARLLDAISLAAVFDHARGVLAIVPHPDPRAYLAFDDEVVAGWREAVERMASRRDFHVRALLEPGAPAFAPSPGAHAASAAIASFQPERVVVRASSDAPAILVLAEAWYPGWRATVGGAPAAVFPVNGWMRGVLVPQGESEVIFSYHPRMLGWGLALSAASLALWAALVWGGRRRLPDTAG